MHRILVAIVALLVLSGCAAHASEQAVPTPIVVTVPGPTTTTTTTTTATVPGPTITKTVPGPSVTITKAPHATNPDSRFLAGVRTTWPELDGASDASLVEFAHTICEGFPVGVDAAAGAKIIVKDMELSLQDALDFIDLAAQSYCPKYA
jgi:hypothetical protein